MTLPDWYRKRLEALEAQRSANARLIAAAPELLDVLKEIVQLWDHHCYAHGDGQPSALHVKASAAIAKAEVQV